MLPSILSRQLEKGLSDYIEATFPMTNDCFKGSIDKLLKTKDSVYHEPYIAVKMPFRTSDEEDDFEAVTINYKSYVHQHKAFKSRKQVVNKTRNQECKGICAIKMWKVHLSRRCIIFWI